MGDSRTSPMIDKRKIFLKLTSSNVLTLSDVVHVLDIHWNLVLVSPVVKDEWGSLFHSDNIMLTKNNVFVGNNYYNQGLFMLNVSKIINNNNVSSSIYLVDSCDIWHGRLGHVNFSNIKKMIYLSSIPRLSLENHEINHAWNLKPQRNLAKL